MKKLSLTLVRERIIWYCLVIVQGILFALLSIYILNDRYQDSWAQYGQNETSIMINLNEIAHSM